MPAYELRSGGDVKNKKQSVADLKYRRLTELNARLKEDLDRPRVKVSEAALSCVTLLHYVPSHSTTNLPNSLISYCNNTRDFMVPSVWGQVCDRALPMAFARASNLFLSRSISARTPTLPNSREVAAPSCNALTTELTRHDISLSRSLFSISSFLLLNSGLLHDHPPWTRHCARTVNYLGLNESSAGPARNLPRQGSSTTSTLSSSPFASVPCPHRQCA